MLWPDPVVGRFFDVLYTTSCRKVCNAQVRWCCPGLVSLPFVFPDRSFRRIFPQLSYEQAELQSSRGSVYDPFCSFPDFPEYPYRR